MKAGKLWILTPVLALVWCFLSGAVSAANFLMGLIMGTVTLWLFRPFFPWQPSPPRLLRKIPSFLRYLSRFSYEVVKANLQVIYLVLHPKMPIRPGIISFTTRHRSPLGTTLLANSITLTPGTLSIEAEGGRILVHSLTAEAAEALRSGSMGERVAALEDKA